MHIEFLNGTDQEQALFRDAVEEFTEETPIPVPGFPLLAPLYYVFESFYFIYTVPAPVQVEFSSTAELDDDFATTTTSDFTIPNAYDPEVEWAPSWPPADPPVFKQCLVRVRDQLIAQIGEKGFKDVVRHEMAHVAMAWLAESSIVSLCEMFGGTRDQWRSGNWSQHIEEASAESFKDYFTHLAEDRNYAPNRTDWHLPKDKAADFRRIFNSPSLSGPSDLSGDYGAPSHIEYHWIEAPGSENPGLIFPTVSRTLISQIPLIDPPEIEPHAWQVVQEITVELDGEGFAIPYVFGQGAVFAQLKDFPGGVYSPITDSDSLVGQLIVLDDVGRNVGVRAMGLADLPSGAGADTDSDLMIVSPYGAANYLDFEGPYYLETPLGAILSYTHVYRQLFIWPGPTPPGADEGVAAFKPVRLDFHVEFGGGGTGRPHWWPFPQGNINASDGPFGKRPRKAIAGRVGPGAVID